MILALSDGGLSHRSSLNTSRSCDDTWIGKKGQGCDLRITAGEHRALSLENRPCTRAVELLERALSKEAHQLLSRFKEYYAEAGTISGVSNPRKITPTA